MTRYNSGLLVALTAITLLAICLALPAPAHGSAGAGPSAAAGGPIPWLDDVVAQVLASLAKIVQDLMEGVGILLWTMLKLCGIVGLLGSDFSNLFGSVIVEAINAVVSGSIATVIKGSLMVSIALLGASLLSRLIWPELKVVSFQRIVVWGTVIQAFLLNAPGIYTDLEAMRVDLAEEVAQAVASGAVPGCSGDTVETILCITGTNPTEVENPDLTALPDTIPPYGETETIHDLYEYCAYNPPYYYGDPECDPDDPQGDPWDVLTPAQSALGNQTLSLVLGFLVLAYGVLQLALGLAAGMMFVLFPVSAMFAFYLPLESFPAGVIRNYVGIFLKSVVLLTLAAVVIRLFTVAAGNLIALAAVGLIDLLICGIMAKEALASLLGSISFVGNSVSNIGASMGLTGAGGGSGGAPSGYPSPESRLAASMIGGGPVAQALMGAPNPYMGSSGRGLAGAAGDRLGALKGGAQAAVSAAVGAGTGGVGFLAGAAAASKGASFGALALGGQAASTLGGPSAGKGFGLGAGLGALRQAKGNKGAAPAGATRKTTTGGTAPTASTQGTPPTTPTEDTTATAPTGSTTRTTPTGGQRLQSPTSFRQALNTTTSGRGDNNSPPALGPVQSIAGGQTVALPDWTPDSARQVQNTAAELAAAPPEVQQGAYDLMGASHDVAGEWADAGRSPALDDGTLDPAFAEAVTQRAPAAARALTVGQAKAGIPAGRQVRRGDVIALGAARARTIPARQVQRGFARAVRDAGGGGDFGAALQGQLGAGPEAIFGGQAGQAVQAATQMQQNGLGNDLGRQLAETVQEDLGRSSNVSPQQFRDRHLGRMRQWDRATGDAARTDDVVESLIGLGALGPAAIHDAPQVKQPGPRARLSEVRAAETPPPTFTEPDAPTPPPAPVEPEATAASPQPAPTPPPDAEHVTPEGQAYDPALFEDLRTWRKAEADGMDKAAFHVFTDATLSRIAAAQPQTRDELLAVKGVGPKKLDQFGPSVLDITRKQPKEDAS